MATFNRAAFLSAATTLLEDVIPAANVSILGLGAIAIRELTAAQRLEAVEVAKTFGADGDEVTLPDGTAKIDAARYWAAIITMSVLDPATCYDEAGAFVEGRGTLLLTPADIFDLSERGKEVVQTLAQRILNLSWMTRGDMFRSNPTPDARQSAPGSGAGPAGIGVEQARVGTGDDGAVLGA